jgi:hypothetical protein
MNASMSRSSSPGAVCCGNVTRNVAGSTPTIVKGAPLISTPEELPAVAFEKYLKTGSGREFARRHFG